MPWYQSLAVSIGAGIIAAYVTFWLSLGRFYRERWWQRRFDGCAAVIEAVHDLKRYSDLLWGEEFEGKKYADDFKSTAASRSNEASRLLRRYADLGRLALPEEVASILVTHFAERDAVQRPETFGEYLDEERFAEAELLRKLTPAAITGLYLNRTWRTRLLGR